MGISLRSSRTAFRSTPAFIGRTRTFRPSAAGWCAASCRSFLGSTRRPGSTVGAAGPDWTSSRISRGACTVVGIAAGRRTGESRRSAVILEPAGSRLGPAEACHASGTTGSRRSRLGPARRGGRAAADCSPLMGCAGIGRMGCPEDRGARGSRGAVVVCASRASGRAGGRSAAVECATSDSGMVSAGCSARRKCAAA